VWSFTPVFISVWHCSVMAKIAPEVEKHCVQGWKWAYTPSTLFIYGCVSLPLPLIHVGMKVWTRNNFLYDMFVIRSSFSTDPEHLSSSENPFPSWIVLSQCHHQCRFASHIHYISLVHSKQSGQFHVQGLLYHVTLHLLLNKNHILFNKVMYCWYQLHFSVCIDFASTKYLVI
jgi:hypothetical protein